MEVTKPTLMVNETICRRNIREMIAKANRSGVILRPHFKTHQSKEVGEWFREEGLKAITVSSVSMAEYFADCGWDDITIAFPYNLLEWKAINELAGRVTLNVIIISREALDHLRINVKNPLHYWIKIDVGTHRTGILPEKAELIEDLSKSGNQHHFEGLLAHAGHSYTQLIREKAKDIFDQSIKTLTDLKMRVGVGKISYGDTPSCSMLNEFPGVDELRPGNFVFYDTMQESFGVCDLVQIAVCMACPVVAIHTDRNEVIIYGGAVHFSKDYISNESVKFGTVVKLDQQGWQPVPIGGLVKISQEHGIIRPFDNPTSFKIGDLVGVLPVHSCLTADLQGYYVSLSGRKLTKIQRPQ